ncbi:hypothetical protein ACFLYP_02470 [Chloroflexota bacterium]
MNKKLKVVGLLLLGLLVIVRLMLALDGDGQNDNMVHEDGEIAAGDFPEEINSGDTLAQLSERFHVPLEVIQAAFELDDVVEVGGIKVGEVSNYYPYIAEDVEINIESVRMFVALIREDPFYEKQDVYLPASTLNILISNKRLSPEQIDYLEDHIIYFGAETPIIGTPKKVNSRTTFEELFDWGLEIEKVEEIMGVQIGDARSVTVIAFCDFRGLDFEQIKQELEAQLSHHSH